MKIDTPGSGADSNGGTAGAVVGVLVFILLLSVTAGSVGLLLVFLSKRHKKEQFQRMQMDILAVYVPLFMNTAIRCCEDVNCLIFSVSSLVV